MPLRVNPILLLSLILIFVLSFGIWASAQLGVNPIIGVGQEAGLAGGQPTGGSGGDPASIAEGKMGAPFAMGVDGPDAFSCVGLMRYVLREAGIDPNAPWVPEEYLSRYTPVAPGDEKRGDIMIFPGWATMVTGDGNVISANEMEGFVTKTPISIAGQPLGVVRPGAPTQPVTNDPLAGQTTDPLLAAQTTDPLLAGQTTDPLLAAQTTDPLLTGQTTDLSGYYGDPSTGYYGDPSTGYYGDPSTGYYGDLNTGYVDPNIGYVDPSNTGYVDPNAGIDPNAAQTVY